MIERLVHRFIVLTALCAGIVAAAACGKDDPEFNKPQSNNTATPSEREGSEETRHVALIYLAGYNSLSKYMKEDYNDLLSGYFPVDYKSRGDNVLLVYTQQTPVNYDYSKEFKSYLIKLNSDLTGKVIADTLVTYGKDVNSADSKTLNTVLKYILREFPAKDYGLVLSSHGTGWLPAGYTTSSKTESLKPQRSICQSQNSSTGSLLAYEIDIRNFAEAFPMKFEYILLDACLMGCVEVAYQLKDVCHYFGASPAEVLADGYDYTKLGASLLKGKTPNVLEVCEDFFAQYNTPTCSVPYCTSSLIDCSKLDRLAERCGDFFSNHRADLAKVDGNDVQGYFQYGWHWFYDLKDIIAHAGATTAELDEIQEALDDCVLYNAATPYFISFPITTHCGLSMYLPSDGNSTLDIYYRSLEWNKATNLLEIK